MAKDKRIKGAEGVWHGPAGEDAPQNPFVTEADLRIRLSKAQERIGVLENQLHVIRDGGWQTLQEAKRFAADALENAGVKKSYYLPYLPGHPTDLVERALRILLREAQGEWDRWKGWAEAAAFMLGKTEYYKGSWQRHSYWWQEQCLGAQAERHAAIERGKLLWREHLAGDAFWRVLTAVRARDATKQRALVERIYKVCKHTLEGDRSSGWYKMVVFDIGQITTPAEAQEEGAHA